MAVRCSDLCIHVRISHFTSTDSPRRSQGCLGARARRVAMTTTDAPPRPTRGAQSNPFLTPSTPPRQPFSPLQSCRTHPPSATIIPLPSLPSVPSPWPRPMLKPTSSLANLRREGIFPLTITGNALTRRGSRDNLCQKFYEIPVSENEHLHRRDCFALPLHYRFSVRYY